MQLTQVHHGKFNRQNKKKMGEDRQRKLITQRITNNLTIELNN